MNRNGPFVVSMILGLAIFGNVGATAQTRTVLINHRRSGTHTFRSLDLNTASKADLKTLPGIDAGVATNIIAGRPYKGTEDLIVRKVISDSIYAQIKDRLFIGNAKP
jgi:DNA uptake protein ComE-like DNA-binding protein